MKGFTMIELEHYLAGTLDAARRQEIDRAIPHDPALRSFLEERRAIEARFALDPRVRSFEALVPAKKPPLFGYLFAFAATSAAAVLLIMAPEPEIAVRGGVTVRAMVMHDQRTKTVTSGTVLAPGDRLRIQIDDPEGGHPVVIWAGQDEARVLHSPSDLGIMTPPTLTLPDSWEVGREPGAERIYVVLCRDPPDIDRWPVQIAETYDDWIPPAGCRVGLFEWRVE